MARIATLIITFLQPAIRRLYQKYSIPRSLVFILDNSGVFLIFLFAYLLRFNFDNSAFLIRPAMLHACIALAVYSFFSIIFRTYAGLIRHTTLSDILNVFLCTTVSFLFLTGATLLVRRINPGSDLIIPLSILIIHWVSITVLLSCVRFAIKLVYQVMSISMRKNKRVLLYGAGALGSAVRRVIQGDPASTFHIAGYLDDNRKLHGKNLNGIQVYGAKVLTKSFVQKNHISVLIFAIRDIAPSVKSRIIQSALNIGLEVLEPPSFNTWLNGQFKISQIRKVRIEDLLGREPIQLNMQRIGSELSGKTILVTGAAGSIGSEIVRQLIRFDVGNLILLDQAETPVFHLENELRSQKLSYPVITVIGDVTNVEKMELIFRRYRPDMVFHAAAYKHVPLMEENPHEAIRVNVGGTKVLTRMAMR